MTTDEMTNTFPTDPASAHDDLAFMRSVLAERVGGWRLGGLIYLAAGLLYGAQALVACLALAGPFNMPPLVQLYAAIIASGGFLAVMAYVLIKRRRQPPFQGVASRAINAAFTGVGLANVAAAVVFAIAAFRAEDLMLWLLFPVIVMALQGAAWFAVAAVMRSTWMRLVAAGWFIAAVVTGYLHPSLPDYLLAVSVTMLVLMAAPGIAMMRMGKESD